MSMSPKLLLTSLALSFALPSCDREKAKAELPLTPAESEAQLHKSRLYSYVDSGNGVFTILRADSAEEFAKHISRWRADYPNTKIEQMLMNHGPSAWWQYEVVLITDDRSNAPLKPHVPPVTRMSGRVDLGATPK